MSTERNWLQITESVSLVASGVGTIAAAVYGQAAIAALPLTAALALNFASRQRLQQQMELDTRSGISQLGRTIELMGQEVDKLPKQQPDISPITESVLRLQDLTLVLATRQEELGQQFQTRSEIQRVGELERSSAALREELSVLGGRIDNFPMPKPVDLSGIEGETNNLRTQLESLNQEFSGRPEVVALPQFQQETGHAVQKIKQEIANLRERLLAISAQFEDRIELQTLPEMQQETSAAIARLQEVETEIGNLNEQILALSEQFNARPEIAAFPQLQQSTSNAIDKIEEKIASLRTQSESLVEQFSKRPEILLLPQIEQEKNNAIAQLQKLEEKVSNLRDRISTLTEQFSNRPELRSLPQLQQETSRSLQKIEGESNNLRRQLENLTQQFYKRPEAGTLPKIESEVKNIRNSLDNLSKQFNKRPEIAALPQIQKETSRSLQELQSKLDNLRAQLENITAQFSSRSEVAKLSQMQQESRSGILQVHKLIEMEINYLREQMAALTEYFNVRPEVTALPEMQQQTSDALQKIEGIIGNLSTQLETLAAQFGNRPEIAALPQMQAEMEGKVGNLCTQLEKLVEQFSLRPEIGAIANLESTVKALLEPPKLSNWPGVKIKVIGIGESGKNAIDKMMANKLNGIELWLIDTDDRTLELSSAANKLQIGESLTQGSGTGGDSALARLAGAESRSQIEAAIQPADLIFIVAGMGGGTGSAVTPIIAEIAKEVGALTVAIVTRPFVHEGKNRVQLAEEGIADLQEKADMLVAIPINKVFSTISEWTPIEEAFRVVNDLESQAVEGICNIINNRGLVNVDFGELKQAIASSGLGGIGIGMGSGKSRAKTAAMAAISSPLMQMENKKMQSIIFYITGGSDLSLQEVNEAAKIIKEFVSEDANIIFGAGIDERLKDEVRVTAIVTGLVS